MYLPEHPIDRFTDGVLARLDNAPSRAIGETMSPTTATHTPGALRAGRNISEKFRRALPNLPERFIFSNAETLAAIIDAETGAPEILEVLEAIVCALNVDRDRLGRLDTDAMSGEALRQLAINYKVNAGRDRMEQIKNVAEAAIRKARGEL